MTLQLALNAAGMHLQTESLLDRIGQLLNGERSIRRSLLGDELHDLGGQLVATLWPALVRKQTGKSVLAKSCLRLVEGWPGQSEGFGGLADGVLVDVNLAQHLVLDLGEIVGIEEVGGLKQRMGDGFRMGVEGAVAAKRLALGLRVWRWRWRHERDL